MALCDYFLQLVSSTGGPVEGESTDAQFPKQIRLETWTWGATNAATIGSATGGAGAGKVKFGEFHFTVRVNKASVALMKACCAGAHYKTAVVTCRKAGDTPQVYLKITMGTVFVTSYKQTADEHVEALVTEEVTLAYGQMGLEYGVQGPDGKVNALDQKGGWNQVTNKAT